MEKPFKIADRVIGRCPLWGQIFNMLEEAGLFADSSILYLFSASDMSLNRNTLP